jgi:hypothetical protein
MVIGAELRAAPIHRWNSRFVSTRFLDIHLAKEAELLV